MQTTDRQEQGTEHCGSALKFQDMDGAEDDRGWPCKPTAFERIVCGQANRVEWSVVEAAATLPTNTATHEV